MSCPVRTTVPKSLSNRNLIGENRKIINEPEFVKYNTYLTALAREKYNVKAPGNLLNIISNNFNHLTGNTYRRDNISTILRYEFNDQFADELDGLIEDYESKIELEEILNPEPAVKEGVGGINKFNQEESKQDIQGFKEFVNSTLKQSSDEESEDTPAIETNDDEVRRAIEFMKKNCK